jgi:sigma-B regulation protein RsbU (phosphoserine phosphatase)
MSQNPLMGAIEDLSYTEVKMKLEPGETLVMFTDGVNEAMNKDYQEFGDNRLAASLQKCAGQSCQQIIDSVKADVAAFVGEMEQSDDITLFALKRLK